MRKRISHYQPWEILQTVKNPEESARGAHEARALWAKQRGVSPMRQGEPQASLRAMRNDHAELWNRSPFAL